MPGSTAQFVPGMEMTGENITLLSRRRIMCRKEWTNGYRSVVNDQLPAGRNFKVEAIVVAPDNFELQLGMLLTPACELLNDVGRGAGFRVPEVTQHNQPLRTGCVQDASQTLQGCTSGTAGNRNALRSERLDFAEMSVRNEHGLFV